MDSFRENLRSFLFHIDKKDWNRLKSCHLWNWRIFHYVNLDFKLLDAAISLWDPIDNVFRFGDHELCPLLEEFSAILKIPCDTPIAMPECRFQFTANKMDFFEMRAPARREVVLPGHENSGLSLYGALRVCRDTSPNDPSWIPLMCLLLL